MPSAASGTELEEGATGVGEAIDALAREELAALDVPGPSALAAPERRALLAFAQIRHERFVRRVVGRKLRRPRSRVRVEHRAHAGISDVWGSVST